MNKTDQTGNSIDELCIMSAGCGVSSFAHNEKNIRCITDDHNTSNILKRGVVVYNRVVLVFVGKN